jgi:hypothetical protein
MTPELQDRIIARLVDSGAADEPWALAIVAAMDGAAQLSAYLQESRTVTKPVAPEASASALPVERPGAYVSSITVEGFRGVGAAATLKLTAGPGLTLVVGRNGSGKSSFAEGLEFLLTGRNYRWEKRSKVWCDGWRNLHQRERVSLKADLLVEGQGTMTVSKVWTGENITNAETQVKRHGAKSQTLDSMQWAAALATFRPFLSNNELGSLLEEGPSKLYDALSTVLGLEELAEVQSLLAAARKERQAGMTAAKATATQIAATIVRILETTTDQRLSEASRAVMGPVWDTATLSRLVSGTSASASSELEWLAQLESLPIPDEWAIAGAIERLRTTDRAHLAFAGTNAERSRERAGLLEQAMRFHTKHHGADCPVCGTADVLSAAWVTAVNREIETLKAEAAACEAAGAAARAAIVSAQRFISPLPAILAKPHAPDLETVGHARDRWQAWASGHTIESAAELADHLENHLLELTDALRALIDEAHTERSRREDSWRPVATMIAGWLPAATTALQSRDYIAQLKAAEEWWSAASDSIRDERFTPIADRAVAVWKQLRLQSNVDLGDIELEGTAHRRHVSLQVTVDGSPAAALGVMSQGELHSLALSLFLPRATLPESPFRFIAIDDPVQSMDPARVEGLARVLADTARTRQVIVFTHDDRLPEATRRLGIPATVLSVTRRAQSIVEVRQTHDPVSSLLDDARSIALTTDLPKAVGPRVVPGFCRLAIETACMETVRRRRLLRGEAHDQVEALLGANARTSPLMALALFDDEKRTSDVLPRLNKFGPWAADAFQCCKAGAHVAHQGDLSELIRYSERLARQIAQAS